MPEKKRDRGGVLVTEMLSQVDVIYESSEGMTLNEVQVDARLASMEDEGDDEDGYDIDSDDN